MPNHPKLHEWEQRIEHLCAQIVKRPELTWLWDITTHADKTIIMNNSKGVHSRFYKPGPLSEMEDLEQSFVDWILRELQRD